MEVMPGIEPAFVGAQGLIGSISIKGQPFNTNRNRAQMRNRSTSARIFRLYAEFGDSGREYPRNQSHIGNASPRENPATN